MGKLHANKDTRGFLKWFKVKCSPTSTIIVFLSPLKKGCTHNLNEKGLYAQSQF